MQWNIERGAPLCLAAKNRLLACWKQVCYPTHRVKAESRSAQPSKTDPVRPGDVSLHSKSNVSTISRLAIPGVMKALHSTALLLSYMLEKATTLHNHDVEEAERVMWHV